jgi:hypothetical protein
MLITPQELSEAEVPKELRERGLEAVCYNYVGKPFVGRVQGFTIKHPVIPLEMFTLCHPTSNEHIGGETRIYRFEDFKSYVIDSFGSDLEDVVTFDPPPNRLVGRPGSWMVEVFQPLNFHQYTDILRNKEPIK